MALETISVVGRPKISQLDQDRWAWVGATSLLTKHSGFHFTPIHPSMFGRLAAQLYGHGVVHLVHFVLLSDASVAETAQRLVSEHHCFSFAAVTHYFGLKSCGAFCAGCFVEHCMKFGRYLMLRNLNGSGVFEHVTRLTLSTCTGLVASDISSKLQEALLEVGLDK